ncbi:MAG: hypothetical protein M1416_01420 [Candidatus Pacearchaeota archaeon]|nr:hypothetical protein [Candidatus Pacearchaeota archaeon]
MKINGVKLNKKNFWIPLLVSLTIFFLIIFFVTLSQLLGNAKLLAIIPALQFATIISSFMFPAIFFIIRRLLSKNPKKVFYFELPILAVIYSVIIFVNSFIGFMLAGPMLENIWQFFVLIFPQVIFIIIWLTILTISLYFYYKKNNFFKK